MLDKSFLWYYIHFEFQKGGERNHRLLWIRTTGKRSFSCKLQESFLKYPRIHWHLNQIVQLLQSQQEHLKHYDSQLN